MVVSMDYCKNKPLGSVAQQKIAPPGEEISRPPLLPSEKNNAAPNVRKLRTREVTSRYKSGTMPIASSLSTPGRQRFPSPSAPRTTPVHGSPVPKRAQSAERRRPSTPLSRSSAPSSLRPSAPPSSPSRPSTPVRDSAVALQLSTHRLGGRTADGLWPSMRSLSSSFQSESISIPIGKRDKSVTSSNSTTDRMLKCSGNVLSERKRTPLRGKSTSDQSENPKPVEKTHSRVLDQHRWPGIAGAKSPSSVTTRSMDLTYMGVSSRGVSPRRRPASDGPSRVLNKSTSDGTRRMSFDGIGRADLEIGSNASLNPPERASSLTRPTRTLSLPIVGAPRSSSPHKSSSPSTSSSRSIASPSRTRPSSPFSSSSSMSGRSGISSSVLSYIVDVRKGKKNANHIEDAHQLRILYNWYLQWRFINARAENAASIQKMTMEDALYSTWITISELHDSVVSKKINMQDLRNQLKLNSILEEQMVYLEDWASLESDHSGSLAGAIEALKASTLRLPVSVGTRADVQAVKEAINSAVDFMRSMGSSICSLLPNVERTNSLVSELANLAAEERAMLDECRELLASTAAMQVQQSSLRTHLLQLNQDMLKGGLSGPG